MGLYYLICCFIQYFIILTIHIEVICSTIELSQQQQQQDRLATFSLKFLEFHNHAHRRNDGSCCGRPIQSSSSTTIKVETEICKAECALEFRICIEPYTIISILSNSTKIYNGPCMYGEVYTGHWGNTDITYGLLEACVHSIGIMHP
ncbi:unnamed protein product [Schistosoma rodhaini]|uniref:Notch ligand N-terminal domain-containing protein n=1 Tax=Schistosoma rodhaini TaxID=6188 RepID=A0AA85FM72_9TREM|nr:unnamed protein product [Schistosoma rodhaini]